MWNICPRSRHRCRLSAMPTNSLAKALQKYSPISYNSSRPVARRPKSGLDHVWPLRWTNRKMWKPFWCRPIAWTNRTCIAFCLAKLASSPRHVMRMRHTLFCSIACLDILGILIWGMVNCTIHSEHWRRTKNYSPTHSDCGCTFMRCSFPRTIASYGQCEFHRCSGEFSCIQHAADILQGRISSIFNRFWEWSSIFRYWQILLLSYNPTELTRDRVMLHCILYDICMKYWRLETQIVDTINVLYRKK